MTHNPHQSGTNNQGSRSNVRSKVQERVEKNLDDFVVAIVRGLDLFIAQATSASVGEVARILYHAKQELVYWAVEENFHETPQSKFINQHLYNNDLFAASDFLRRALGNKRKKPFTQPFPAKRCRSIRSC